MPIVILIIFILLVILAAAVVAAIISFIGVIIAAIAGGFLLYGVVLALNALGEWLLESALQPAYYHTKNRISDYRAEKKRREQIKQAKIEKLKSLHEKFETEDRREKIHIWK